MKTKIQNLISNGDTKGAIEELSLRYQDNKSLLDEITIIQSAYNQISKNKRLNIISDELYQREINRINNEILNFPSGLKIQTRRNEKKINIVFGLIILVAIVGVAVLIFYQNNKKEYKQIAKFMELDKNEVVDEFQKVKNEINEFCESDTTIKEIVVQNKILDKLNSYENEYLELQNMNIPAVERGDLLYSRELRKKILSLPEKHNLDRESMESIQWHIPGVDSIWGETPPPIMNFIDDKVHTITLKAANSCGMDTNTAIITVLPLPTDTINQKKKN